MIEKKDETGIGFIAHFLAGNKYPAIRNALMPDEKAKGCGSEAAQVMVDYSFLSSAVPRIEAQTHPQNTASQHVLEKAGFKREGIIRRCFFRRGIRRDTAIFGVLRAIEALRPFFGETITFRRFFRNPPSTMS